MKFPFIRLLPLLAALGATAVAREAPAPTWWTSLALHQLDGQPMPPPKGWIVAVFLSPECPLSNQSVPVLAALAREFSDRGVTVLGVYCDPALTEAEARRHAEEYAIPFPLTLDRAQRLVRLAGATYTPEAVVLAGDGRVLYRGRIDDRVGGSGEARPAAVRHDLREILDRLLAGEPGPFPDQPGFGCDIPAPVAIP